MYSFSNSVPTSRSHGLSIFRSQRKKSRLVFVAVCTLLAPQVATSVDESRGMDSFDWAMLEVSPTLIFSRALSLAVIAGACIGKFPQIHAIHKARSAAGISTVSMWTEAASLSIQFSYNVVRETPFMTYAEIPILFPQILLLILVAAWEEGYLNFRVLSGCAILIACTASMAFAVVPAAFTTTLYAASALLALITVLPQVIINHREKSTGQLSFVVTAMTFSGLTTRLITTFLEVDDIQLRATMTLNWLLVCTLMLQFLAYRNEPSRETDLYDVSPSRFSTRESSSMNFTPKLRRSATVLDLVSALGSHRCLTDLIDEDCVTENLQHLHSRSAKSFQHFTRSVSAFNTVDLFQQPFERLGSSAPDLSCEPPMRLTTF